MGLMIGMTASEARIDNQSEKWQKELCAYLQYQFTLDIKNTGRTIDMFARYCCEQKQGVFDAVKIGFKALKERCGCLYESTESLERRYELLMRICANQNNKLTCLIKIWTGT